jgi:hypothetical protein
MCVLGFEAGGIGLNGCWCAQMAIYRCLLDIAAGMDYLHSLGVLHGELLTAILLQIALSHATLPALWATCEPPCLADTFMHAIGMVCDAPYLLAR